MAEAKVEAEAKRRKAEAKREAEAEAEAEVEAEAETETEGGGRQRPESSSRQSRNNTTGDALGSVSRLSELDCVEQNNGINHVACMSVETCVDNKNMACNKWGDRWQEVKTKDSHLIQKLTNN